MGSAASCDMPDFFDRQKAQEISGQYWTQLESKFDEHQEHNLVKREIWENILIPLMEKNYDNENSTATERATVFFKRMYAIYGYQSRCPLEAFVPIMMGHPLSEYLCDKFQKKFNEGGYIKMNEFLEGLVFELISGRILPFLDDTKATEKDYREAFDYCNKSVMIATQVVEVYNKIDTDGSGYIEKSELENFVGKKESITLLQDIDEGLKISNYNEKIEKIELISYFMGFKHLGLDEVKEILEDWNHMIDNPDPEGEGLDNDDDDDSPFQEEEEEEVGA